VKVSDVLSDALTGYRVFWRHLALLALIGGAAVLTLVIVLVLALGGVGLVAAVFISIVANFWIAGLLVQTVDNSMQGEDDASIESRFRAFFPLMNTVSGAALLLSAVMLPGLALSSTGHPIVGLPLSIGGIVVLTWWALVLPLIVIEKCFIGEALARSRELVAGKGWQVFSFLAVVGLLSGLLSSAVERILLAVVPNAPALALSALFDTVVITPFLAVALVSLYFALSPSDSSELLPTPA